MRSNQHTPRLFSAGQIWSQTIRKAFTTVEQQIVAYLPDAAMQDLYTQVSFLLKVINSVDSLA